MKWSRASGKLLKQLIVLAYAVPTSLKQGVNENGNGNKLLKP